MYDDSIVAGENHTV